MNCISFLRVLFGIVCLLPMVAEDNYGDEIRFNEQIRPILSDRCFACHGPDGAKRQADLRLDIFDDAVSS